MGSGRPRGGGGAPAAGNIVERTLDTAGNIVGSQVVGNVSSLSVVDQTTNSAGQTMLRLADASGAVVELTLDTAGNVVNATVVQPAPGGQH